MSGDAGTPDPAGGAAGAGLGLPEAAAAIRKAVAPLLAGFTVDVSAVLDAS